MVQIPAEKLKPRAEWAPPALLFHHAEEAAHEAIETILGEWSDIAYLEELKKRSWRFAAEATAKKIGASIDLNCMYMEPDEDISSWFLDAPPCLCPIDNWAPRALPMKKRKQASLQKVSTASVGHEGQRDGRMDTRPAAKKEPQPADDNWRKIKLETEVVIDEEEVQFRDAKSLEDKKKKDEEARITSSKKVDQTEKSKNDKQDAEMSKKPYAFDSDGNVLWVEPPNPNKLPKVSTEMPYKFVDDDSKKAKEEAPAPKKPAKPTKSTRKGSGFVDGFMKLPMEQPNILDVVQLKAGVAIESQGRTKAGPAQEEKNMSYAEYKKYIGESFS